MTETLDEFSRNLEGFRRKFYSYSQVCDEEFRERLELLRTVNREIRQSQRMELDIEERLVSLNSRYREKEAMFKHLESVCEELIRMVNILERDLATFNPDFAANDS